MFDGRLSEDFKLATGTWVSVGPLRSAVIAHAHRWYATSCWPRRIAMTLRL